MRAPLSYLLPVCAICVLFGCKKEAAPSNSIIGTWELSEDIGGWTGVHYHKAGNDTLAVFTATTYAFYDGSIVVKSGTYTTRKDSLHIYAQIGNHIIFDGQDNSTREFFDVQNNQLTFYLDAEDAGSTIYRRIK